MGDANGVGDGSFGRLEVWHANHEEWGTVCADLIATTKKWNRGRRLHDVTLALHGELGGGMASPAVAAASVGDGLPGYINNTAGTNLAKVVCRQLGYNNSAIMLPDNVTDGAADQAVVLDVTYPVMGTRCAGHEPRLMDCQLCREDAPTNCSATAMLFDYAINCDHTLDIGVRCFGARITPGEVTQYVAGRQRTWVGAQQSGNDAMVSEPAHTLTWRRGVLV